MKKILLVDSVHELLPKLLEETGFTCIPAWDLEIEDIIRMTYENIEGIIIRSRFKLDQQIIEKFGDIKFIARFGSGMENIDVQCATQRGIKCINAPEGNCNAVAEHAIGMLIALMRNINTGDHQLRNGEWIREGNRGHEIEGKTVAIIGFGRTGSSFAEKLNSFNCKVIAYDPYTNVDSKKYPYVEQTEMSTIFSGADIISIHVPLTAETTKMVNAEYLKSFQKKLWLINTSRGKVIDTEDLVDAMKNDKVQGVALDVLEYESHSFENIQEPEMPYPLKFLINNNNVILTPHIAGWTHESNEKLSRIVAERILKIYE